MKFLSTLKGKLTVATCATVITGGVGFMLDIQELFFGSPSRSVVIEQIKSKPTELDAQYQELSNPKLAQKHINKDIIFEATYLGPWNLEQVYGVTFPENSITLNHRDASYTSQNTPLGSSDLAIPDFALTVPTALSDEVLKLKSHSKVKIAGTVKSVSNQFGQNVIIVEATSVVPAG